MILETYTCDQWKTDFMKASEIKLSGVKSEFAEKIIYKLSPCNDDIVQKTLHTAIETYGKNRKNHKY